MMYLNKKTKNSYFMLSAAVILALAFASGAGAREPSLTHDKVEKLSLAAQARKSLYEEHAKAKKELVSKQKQERDALLLQHREARKSFTENEKTPEDRRAFYLGQREEMASLKKRHKEEFLEFKTSWKDRLKEIK